MTKAQLIERLKQQGFKKAYGLDWYDKSIKGYFFRATIANLGATSRMKVTAPMMKQPVTVDDIVVYAQYECPYKAWQEFWDETEKTIRAIGGIVK